MNLRQCAGALIGALGLCAGAGAADSRCPEIQGAPNVTATVDQGATLQPTAGEMAPVSYTQGLLAMRRPGLMYATVNGRIQRSLDAGCHWTPWRNLRSATGDLPLLLAPAGAEDVYVWSMGQNLLAAIVDGKVNSAYTPGAGVMGLMVYPKRPQRLRHADAAGAIWDSTDSGANWTLRGSKPGAWVHRAVFDPRNPDRIVLGVMEDGAWSSQDGGQTWTRATGFGAPGERVNVFNVVWSPVQPDRVWAMGLNIAENDRGEPSMGRHVFRSDDGGVSFTRVADHSADFVLSNGPLMVPHPKDAGVLYVVHNVGFMSLGNYLYRYDDATGTVTTTHNDYDGIGAIAFQPKRPELMYLGLNNLSEWP